MRTATIKNIPDDLYALLQERAHRNRRSLNQEFIHSLEVATQSPQGTFDFDAALAQLQSRLAGVWITEDEVNTAKREGRP